MGNFELDFFRGGKVPPCPFLKYLDKFFISQNVRAFHLIREFEWIL